MFKIVVRNWTSAFCVLVYEGDKLVGDSRWNGGEFQHNGKTYELRGPYDEPEKYRIFEITPVEAEVWHQEEPKQ